MTDSDEFPEALVLELSEALLRVVRQVLVLPFEELKKGFEEVGETLPPRFEAMGYPIAAQEARRRVAHGILSLALEDRPLAECSEYFERRVAFGFLGLRDRAEIELLFGAHLSRQEGRQAQSLALLQPLRADLRAALDVEEVPAYRFCLERAEKILARMEPCDDNS